MAHSDRIEWLLEQLTILDAADGGAFPYADCRRLHARADRYATLIADVDAYISELAAYRRELHDVQRWSDDKITSVERRLAKSFFEHFPRYAVHRAEMTAADVSALRWILEGAEGARRILLELLVLLRGKPPAIR